MQQRVRPRPSVSVNNKVTTMASKCLINIKSQLLKKGYTEAQFQEHQLDKSYVDYLSTVLKKTESRFVTAFETDVAVEKNCQSDDDVLEGSVAILEIVNALKRVFEDDDFHQVVGVNINGKEFKI